MGITKLLVVEGEAEVLGALRVVSWSEAEGGHIDGLTLDEFYKVLELVKTGAVHAVAPRVEKPTTAPSPGVRATPEEARASQARRSSEDHKPETQKSNVVQMPKTEPNKVDHIDRKDIAPPIITKPEDPALEFPPKDAEAPPFDTAPSGDLPEKIVKTGRFIEVLDWVMKTKGYKPTQVDEIVAACEALRQHIKVVERVRDMRDKVTSNLQAYTEAGAAGA